MGIIECAQNCKYQKDGYCLLETFGKVNTSDGGCPHFLPLLDNGNCLTETSYSD